ncbi:MAG: aldolase catalytic domain-containing protein [Opitutales bacterium]
MNLQILDCTIRDGGYINSWRFSKRFVQALYSAVSESGCQFLEIGFINPKAKNAEPWQNLSARDIDSIRNCHDGGSKISVMINFGEACLDDVPDRKDFGADMIRVATPKKKAYEATQFAARLQDKGYETTINYMGVSTYTNSEIHKLTEIINEFKSAVSYFYLADSFGALLPHRTHEIFKCVKFCTGAKLGFHPHNNLQLAFANSLTAIDAGIDIIDSSVYGMGRGAGNLFTEAILGYLSQRSDQQHDLRPILNFSDLFMEKMKSSYDWGYSLPQFLAGLIDCHPNYPTKLLDEKGYTADDIYSLLKSIDHDDKPRFSKDELERVQQDYQLRIRTRTATSITTKMEKLRDAHGARALLICGGSSVKSRIEELKTYAKANNLLIVSVHNPKALLNPEIVFFGNRRRISQHCKDVQTHQELLIGPEIAEKELENIELTKISRVNFSKFIEDKDNSFPSVLPRNAGVEAIAGLAESGFKEIHICGLDGFTGANDFYYEEPDRMVSEDAMSQENGRIETELKCLHSLSEKGTFSFRIITPTIFNQFFSAQALQIS